MSLVIPDEILQATRMSEAELRQEIAVLLFHKDKLTLSQASRLAGLSQGDLLPPLSHEWSPGRGPLL